jgi:NADH-quinone oxidoreductase E subunit
MFSDEQRTRILEITKRYRKPQAAILEALWIWQEAHGWISDEGMRAVADILQVPEHHVLGVVTFYTMFNKKPVGRHKIEVCTNVSCMLRNSDRIMEHIEKKLSIRPGETTPDGRFTLVEAECLGSCGTAPMMQIGDRYYEDLDEAKIDAIISNLA